MKPPQARMCFAVTSVLLVLWLPTVISERDNVPKVQQCSYLWHYYPGDGLCYINSEAIHILDRSMPEYGTYTEAKRLCRTLGGARLVEPRTREQQGFINRMHSSATWIGLSRDSKGILDWESGSPITWTNWGTGQPGSSPDCGFVSEGPVGGKRWYQSDPCSMIAMYACTRPVTWTTPTTTITTTPTTTPTTTSTTTPTTTSTTTPTITSTRTQTTTPTTTTPVELCEVNPCLNGGVCVKFPDCIRCNCPPGTSGIICQKELCPDGWFYLSAARICVELMKHQGGHSTAVKECLKRNASLPEPRSEKENEQLAEFAKDKRIWLGISDSDHEGEWRYSSNKTSELEYENWAMGQPFNWNQDDDCAVLVGKTPATGHLTAGKWYDRSCLDDCEHNSIVCSKSAAEVV